MARYFEATVKGEEGLGAGSSECVTLGTYSSLSQTLP
jgi:hypothetical protein